MEGGGGGGVSLVVCWCIGEAEGKDRWELAELMCMWCGVWCGDMWWPWMGWRGCWCVAEIEG